MKLRAPKRRRMRGVILRADQRLWLYHWSVSTRRFTDSLEDFRRQAETAGRYLREFVEHLAQGYPRAAIREDGIVLPLDAPGGSVESAADLEAAMRSAPDWWDYYRRLGYVDPRVTPGTTT